MEDRIAESEAGDHQRRKAKGEEGQNDERRYEDTVSEGKHNHQVEGPFLFFGLDGEYIIDHTETT